MINGNIDGIRASVLEKLEALYEMECPRGEFITQEMMDVLAEHSCELNREISIFLSRSGKVLDVSVGSNDNVSLPVLRKRRASLGLSGVRCIHTHPGGSSMLSGVDIGTLLSTRMDCMASLAVKDGKAKSLSAGFIGDQLDQAAVTGPFPAVRIPGAALMAQIEAVTRKVAELIRLQDTGEEQERAVLVGLNTTKASMDELALLADTAGASVLGQFTQSRPRDKGYYIGKGKAKELSLQIAALDVDLAIEKALAYGKDGNPFKTLLNYLTGAKRGCDLELETALELDSEYIKAMIATAEKDARVEARNDKVSLSNDGRTITVRKGQKGRFLDTDGLFEAVYDAFQTGNFEPMEWNYVEIPYVEADLSAYQSEQVEEV
ncbi:MAG: peptidoglycan binding domain-containing protein, partial [Christensenellaceae bacterium]|nr:peptidoglycan binding domain-containing protein [Christensenellaceae bacterium]